MGADVCIGATESELGQVSDMKWWYGLGIFQSMWPKFMGRKTAVSFWEVLSHLRKIKEVPGRG